MQILNAQVSLIHCGIPFQALDAVESALNTFALGEHRPEESRLRHYEAYATEQRQFVVQLMRDAHAVLEEQKQAVWKRDLTPVGPDPDQTLVIRRLEDHWRDAVPAEYSLEIIHRKNDRTAEADLANALGIDRLLEASRVDVKFDHAIGPEDREQLLNTARVFLSDGAFDLNRFKLTIAPTRRDGLSVDKVLDSREASVRACFMITPESGSVFTDPQEGKAAKELAQKLIEGFKNPD